MQIRRATFADTCDVYELTQLAYARWRSVIGQKPLPMDDDYMDTMDTHIVELLEDDGVLCGVLELLEEEKYLLIENIAVHPNHQGKGCGRLLLEHAERCARELRFSEIRLYTNAAFTENLAFYAKNGYAELERSNLIRGNITVHMNKILATGV